MSAILGFTILIVILILALAAMLWAIFYWRSMHKLPIRAMGLVNAPAIPFIPREVSATLFRLSMRELETKMAVNGLTHEYTIGRRTGTGYSFLFPENGRTSFSEQLPERASRYDAARQAFSIFGLLPWNIKKHLESPAYSQAESEGAASGVCLEEPEQFSMTLSTYTGLWTNAQAYLDRFYRSLTDRDVANEEFWQNFARNGLPYNLLLIQKLTAENLGDVRDVLGEHWTGDLQELYEQECLYCIDLNIYQHFSPGVVHGRERFTPATFTLLRQEKATKKLYPLLISVGSQNLSQQRWFREDRATDGAWLYALQAAKASVTVFGIWIGHVYIWHMVTAAMQMTFFQCIPKEHELRQLLAPHFDYLIGFDETLLLSWKDLAPPTSFTSAKQFIALIDRFADGRTFFDDDLPVILDAYGIEKHDFTLHEDWDRYPIVGTFSKIWAATERYVGDWVDASYAGDGEVVSDAPLQAWIEDSADPNGGNVKGLPTVHSRHALKRVLTSLLYRIAAHGTSRLSSSELPFLALAYVPNFPSCLQSSRLPEPTEHLDLEALLTFLPDTTTLGEMVTFYYIFTFSAPYVSMSPLDGIDTELFFGPDPDSPKNRALIEFRKALNRVNLDLSHEATQVSQWPRNIET